MNAQNKERSIMKEYLQLFTVFWIGLKAGYEFMRDMVVKK